MPKRIVICCRDAQQPPFNTMLRYHNFGKELVKRGYEVTIIASNIVHNTAIDVAKRIGSDRCVCDGVLYLYVDTPLYKGNGIRRFFNMARYVIGLKRKKAIISEPDYIIAADAYVFPFAKRLSRSAKIIVDITDLWPLSIIEYAGLKRWNPVVQMFYFFEKKAYIQSDALIFSMEGGAKYVEERKYASRVDPKKIFHINMGIDLVQNDINRRNHREKLAWNREDFNIGYCGSIRQANNVKQICDAALQIKARFNDVQFQIYGNGNELPYLENYCKENGIDNVHFYGRIEKEKIPFLLSNMKVNILTYKQVGLMKYGGSQSKLFDYLAAGKPIICNANFGYNLITRYNCGFLTGDQESGSLAKCIERLRLLGPDELDCLGKNARRVAELYDLPKLTDDLEKVFAYLSRKEGAL